MGFLLRNKILILLFGIAIAGFAWYGMTSGGPAPLLVNNQISGPDHELVETLLALRAVKLDGTIFSENAFSRLQDYSMPIVSEPIGRDNPFAPLRAAGAASTTTAKGAQGLPPPIKSGNR